MLRRAKTSLPSRGRGILLAALATLLPHATAAAVSPGEAAPACVFGESDAARPFDPVRWRGQVVYVDFWASWCAPCLEAFPFLDALHREFENEGLRVVGVGLDEQPEAAQRFLARHPVAFRVVADAAGRCPRQFGVDAMPMSYLVDRAGRVRHVHRGFRAGDAADLRRRVRQLLAEPADAR